MYIGTNKFTSDFYGITAVAGTTTIIINVWYHLLITYNNGTTSIYVNGNREGTNTGTLAQNGFIIGTGHTTYTTPFAGYIDDFRIYNTALTQSQIAALYYGSAHIANQATPYLGYVPSAAVLYQQSIEGNNVADLFYGTANAAPVAVSLWLKNATASAQSFTLALNNGGAGGASRSALYPIASVAPNTWRRVAVKIPGDLIGTWARDNGLGLNVALVLGTNSNVLTATASAWQTGAYFTTETSQNYAASATGFLALQDNAVYVTGVQLEKGTLVTPFEFRAYPVELQLCQRYFEKSYDDGTAIGTNTGFVWGTSQTSNGPVRKFALNASDFYDFGYIPFKVTKRASVGPGLISIYSTDGSLGFIRVYTNTNLAISVNNVYSWVSNSHAYINTVSGLSTNYGYYFHWAVNTEL